MEAHEGNGGAPCLQQGDGFYTEVQRQEPSGMLVAWKTLKRWVKHLEERDELLRIDRPVDVVYEAGAIADLLVKNNGPAVLFE